MAYTFAQISLGQQAINSYVNEYNLINTEKIQASDVLSAAKNYDDNTFLGILGYQIEIALESDLERLQNSMRTLAKFTYFKQLPSSDEFIQFINSNKVSDLEIQARELPKVIPQIKYGIYILLGILFLILTFFVYSKVK